MYKIINKIQIRQIFKAKRNKIIYDLEPHSGYYYWEMLMCIIVLNVYRIVNTFAIKVFDI
jgi:hypothetical protein